MVPSDQRESLRFSIPRWHGVTQDLTMEGFHFLGSNQHPGRGDFAHLSFFFWSVGLTLCGDFRGSSMIPRDFFAWFTRTFEKSFSRLRCGFCDGEKRFTLRAWWSGLFEEVLRNYMYQVVMISWWWWMLMMICIWTSFIFKHVRNNLLV